MPGWDECATLLMDRYGADAERWAREDLADGAVIYPALCVLEYAVQHLGCRGWWDEGPDDEALVLLRACQHHHAQAGDFVGPPIGYPCRDQPYELASWLEQDLEVAHFELLPTEACHCGAEYKQINSWGAKRRVLVAVATDETFDSRDGRCACGRPLSKLGQPEQITFDLSFA